MDNNDIPISGPDADNIRSMIGNQKIWSYFQFLLKSDEFNNRIEFLRVRYLDEDGNLRDGVELAIRRLCRDYGLDEVMWLQSLQDFVATKQVPKETLSTPCLVFDREEVGEEEYPEDNSDPVELEPWSYSHPVIIRLSPYASQREVIDYIKKSYAELIEPIQERYRDEEIMLGRVKKKKKSIQDRNDYIYENKDLPRKEIAHLVYEVYGEILDEGHVGKIISLEKQKREKK